MSGNYILNNPNNFDNPSSTYNFLLDTKKITNKAFATTVKFNNLDEEVQHNPIFNEITFTDFNDLNKQFSNSTNNYNTEHTGVLEAINQMKNILKENNLNNFRFMTNLSMNIKYFANVLDNIKNNVLKIFSLITKLNIKIIVNPPTPPGVPPGTTRENYENLIKALVKTINVYLNQFNLLSSMIKNVKLNDAKARTELLTQSNSLFEKISSLKTTFDTQFTQIGIFSVNSTGNDKILMTYRQIRTIIANSNNFNQNLKNYFNKTYDPKKYTEIQHTIDSITNLDNQQKPISGGSKQIKRTKNKHKKNKKTRKHLSKRRKAFRSKRAY